MSIVLADEDLFGGGARGWAIVHTKSCNLKVNYFAKGFNGENAENPPPSSTSYYTGSYKSITLGVTIPGGDSMSNLGYLFVGWATSATSPTVEYNPGDRVTHSWTSSQSGGYTENLYAVWTDQNVIMYYPDDKTEEEGSICQVKESGETISLSGALFTRIGYTQVGWATQPGGAKVYDLGESYSSDDGLSLYPVWQANTYTITYDANGGTGSMSDQTITYDSTFTPSTCTYTRDGYSFSSWNESPDGKGTRWPIQEYTVTEAEGMTLYAIWKGNEYTITYNANSLSAKGTMATSKAVFGTPFITRRNQFTLFGNTFRGWNTAANGSGESWIPSGVSMDTFKRKADPTWDVSHDVTLYAQWDPTVYPFGRCFLNGKDTKDFGVVVESLPSYYYAERPFTHKQVNGKNGDALLDPNRYENVKKVYKLLSYDSSRPFYESAVALSTWLHSAESDYLRLEDSYEPTSYRLAVYEEAQEIENIEGAAGRVEVTFSCKPQRFLLSGDEEVTIPSTGSTIYNPTVYNARPLIVVEGVGNIVVNGFPITIYYNDNDISIDCDSGNATDLSDANMNEFVYCDDFPILSPGFNVITFDETITSVKITPRWWIL